MGRDAVLSDRLTERQRALITLLAKRALEDYDTSDDYDILQKELFECPVSLKELDELYRLIIEAGY